MSALELGEGVPLPRKAYPVEAIQASGPHVKPSWVGHARLLASVFLDAAGPAVVESPEGLLMRANAAFQRLVGLGESELLGRSLLSHVVESDRFTIETMRRGCLLGRDQPGVEVSLRDNHGASHPSLASASLLTDVDEEPVAVSYLFVDAKQLRQRVVDHERECKRLQAELDHVKNRLQRQRETYRSQLEGSQRLEALLSIQDVLLDFDGAGLPRPALSTLLSGLCSLGNFERAELWSFSARSDGLSLRQVAEFGTAGSLVLSASPLSGVFRASQASDPKPSATVPTLAEAMAWLRGAPSGHPRVFVVELTAGERLQGALRLQGAGLRSDVVPVLDRVALKLGRALSLSQP